MEEGNKKAEEAIEKDQSTMEKGDDSSRDHHPAQAIGGAGLGARPKQPSDKGRIYALETKERQINSIYKQIKEKTDCIQRMMSGNEQENLVQQIYSEWLSSYDNYLSLRSEYTSFLNKQETDPFCEKDSILFTFKTAVQSWFLDQPRLLLRTQINPEDSVSQASTRRSRKSGTVVSSVSSARLREEQNKLAIQMKMEALKKKKELELAKLSLSIQEQQLTLDTELAISEGKTKLMDEFVNASNVSTKPASNVHNLKVTAPAFVPGFQMRDSAPAHHDPAPVSHDPVPSRHDTYSVHHDPAPVHHDPVSSRHDTYSVHHDPAPVHHDPAPVHHDPAPVHHDPAPVHHNPAPVHHDPVSSRHDTYSVHYDPAPVHHDPAPVHHDPAPVHHDPAPVHHDPVSSRHDTYSVHYDPAPVYHDQVPVHHEPHHVHYDYVRNYPVHNELPQNIHQTPHVPYPKQSADQIASVVRHLKKPVPEIHKFTGDPLEYRRFMRQFWSKIVVNTDDDEERLNYLEQYTGGEAYKIVSGYGYLQAGSGYAAALRELEDRYGNNTVIANAFIRRALDWPQVQADRPKELDELGIFLAECQNAISSIEAVRVLEYPENIKRLVMKLPYFYHDRWRAIVQQTRENGSEVTFSQLVNFVKREARKATDPTFGRDALRSTPSQTGFNGKNMKSPSTRSKGSFATEVTSSYDDKRNGLPTTPQADQSSVRRTAFTKPCLFCNNKDHNLENCDVLVTKPYEERIDFLKQNRLCFGCLRFGHQRRKCQNKATCEKCKGRHPSVCHVAGKFVPPASNDSKEKSVKGLTSASVQLSNSVCDKGFGETECTMAIIPVTVRMTNGMNAVKTYAFLDPGSSASFCTESLLRLVGGKGKPMKLTLDTMGNSHTMQTFMVSGMEVGNLSMENYVKMPKLYTKDKLPVSTEHIPTTEDLQRWPHLENIDLPQINADIGLLIGNNVPSAYSPIEVKTGPPGSPHATRSALGWIAWNILRPVSPSVATNIITVNRANVTAVQELEALQDLDIMLQKSINLDYPEHIIDDKRENSQQDKQFLVKVNNSIAFANGHYSISLPFKADSVAFPNNESQARQRLKSLKSKMAANTKFNDDYCSFMADVINKGYAERVSEEDLSREDGKVWYIPHHGVYHPRKPEKIRVVFDCTAQYRGVRLNTELLQGPDMTNSLLAVLLRFRQEKIGLIGDIESMFYQVRVPPEDCDCLRFLWWPGGDTQQEAVAHRMVVHLFGAVSSPSCANAALRKTAEDNQHLFSADVAQVIKNNFYVDDCVASSESEDKAAKLLHNVTAMCKLGGFHLTKWNSNSRTVLQSVDVTERAKEVRSLNLDSDSLPNQRALGVHWCTETDTIGFSIKINDRPVTKRGILSTVCSIYDPLGFASPVLLTGKMILQDLCRPAVGWDDEIPEDSACKWKEWLAGLHLLEDLKINRCVKPADFGELSKCEMHVFSDASEVGYGVCIYLRLVNTNDSSHSCLVLGKSRVAPLKKVSIPRLELTAATVAVRLGRMVREELDFTINDTYYWTDSMSVIRYLCNESKRFHTFVANRLAVIRDGSDPEQWNYVESKNNPADCASRGMQANKFLQHNEWLQGPEFLTKPSTEWPTQDEVRRNIPDDDKEVKRVTATISRDEPDVISELVNRQSSWLKLRAILGWVLFAVRRFRTKQRAKALSKRELNVCLKNAVLTKDILEDAETLLVKHEQRAHFRREILSLSCDFNADRALWKGSPLRKLDPFLSDGVVRVGGRICHADLPFAAKHQAILPKDSRVSQLYLEFIHRCVGHLGRNSMLAALRQKFWLIGASTSIKGLVSRCVTCRKYQARAAEQKMADLPSDRVTPGHAPFSSVGLDYFGPFHVKRGRSLVKRYGVVFTCLTTRAIHLEVACSLTTDSCVNAIRRFVARRGQVEVIRSDNGTNLVGSERELREEVEQLNQSMIDKALQQKNIRWIFNPPSASHHGGIWERMIRTIRKVLYSLLHQQTATLDDESLLTLFCEVESIINGRPITKVSDDCRDLEALTPNHLLLMRGGETLPPGKFGSSDNYGTRRWRQIQYLADIFWRRWTKEYLPMLQERQKWLRPRRNLLVDDIVLVVDTTPRNCWCLGRVEEVTTDRKGLVRSVQVKTKTGTLVRPITKLCLILEADSQ